MLLQLVLLLAVLLLLLLLLPGPALLLPQIPRPVAALYPSTASPCCIVALYVFALGHSQAQLPKRLFPKYRLRPWLLWTTVRGLALPLGDLETLSFGAARPSLHSHAVLVILGGEEGPQGLPLHWRLIGGPPIAAPTNMPAT